MRHKIRRMPPRQGNRYTYLLMDVGPVLDALRPHRPLLPHFAVQPRVARRERRAGGPEQVPEGGVVLRLGHEGQRVVQRGILKRQVREIALDLCTSGASGDRGDWE